ncbi:retrotransposon protein, putative, ty1-copia subclass [Tanacetum coccineum]|uniref:rRNA N-glycosylase n=1 Tax=Tanacetum coccineum TaxID=301880 RepID=A0ABQ5EIZ7_9ASTR
MECLGGEPPFLICAFYDDLTTLPLSFWDYALESATRILNMVPTKKVDKTPYELWYGKVPKLSYLKVWGCEALVKRDTPEQSNKDLDEYAVSLYVRKEDLYVIAVAVRGGQIYEFRGYKEFAGSKSLPYGEGYGDLSTRVDFDNFTLVWTSFETAVEVLIQGMTVNEDKIKPFDWSQPNDIHGLDTASSEQLEPYLRFSKQIHFKYYDQGSGSQGERVNAWLRRRKNCKRGVRHADSIIESLPSDAWNTVPASSKRLKDEVYYILRCERAE